MKLSKWVSVQPVLLEGEGSMAASSFQVGAGCGAGIVQEIEATPMGIIVRRNEERTDLLLTGNGYGIIAEKRKQEPAQLKGAR